MNRTKYLVIAGSLLMLFGLVNLYVLSEGTPTAPTSTPPVAATPVNTTPLPPTLSGVVSNAQGPVAGAVVQIQGKPIQVQTDQHGAYTFTGISGTTPLILTAWSAGHYVGWISVNPSAPNWTDWTLR
jgi:hypothetical protein